MEAPYSNPWCVANLDEFLVYGCPECESRHVTKPEFIHHALSSHPLSREYIPTLGTDDNDISNVPLEGDEPFIKKEVDDYDEEESDMKHEDYYTQDDHMDDQDDEVLDDSTGYIKTEPNVKTEDDQDPEELPLNIMKLVKTGSISLKSPKKPKIRKVDTKVDDDYVPVEPEIKMITAPDSESSVFDDIAYVTADSNTKRSLGSYKSNICYICKDSYKGLLKDLKKHFDAMHPGKPLYYCEKCDAKYMKRESYILHKINVHGEKKKINRKDPTHCYICKDEFRGLLKDLPKHFEDCHPGRDPFKCDDCEVTMKTYKQKQNHFLYKHSNKPAFQCAQCNIEFTSAHSKKVHVESVHMNLCLTCDRCGAEFRNTTNLKRHLRVTHHVYNLTEKKKVKQCDKCEQTFRIAEDMNKHLLKDHEIENKDFGCNECETKWASHLSLELHYAETHKKLMNSCEICGYSQISASLMRKHIAKKHNKLKEFVCHICARKFAIKTMLESHLSIEHGEGETRFKCEHCGKAFYSACNLRNHVEQMHTKDKVYNCGECDYFAYSKKNLGNHISTKHRKANLECEFCGKAFFSKPKLEDHRQAMHLKEGKLRCEICEFVTHSVNTLRKHKRVRHGATLKKEQRLVPLVNDY